MVSKPKKRQVRKVLSVTPEQPKSPPQQSNPEALIVHNGTIVEELLKTEGWLTIAEPVLREMIASVSGRLTNGRYHHGSLTTKWDGSNSIFYAAYQKALMDFSNNLYDFILAKNKVIEDRKTQSVEKDAPVYNPFMEEANED